MSALKNGDEPEAHHPHETHVSTAASKDSWVQCDSCNKWRRIPAVLADKLEDDAQWHCQDNPNAAYAACSVKQELSNEEIDQEEEEEQVRARPCVHMRRRRRYGPCMPPALVCSLPNRGTIF